jgi:hypothetical protein
MPNTIEEQITNRAYELWEHAGKPDGRDEEFYYKAQEELKQGITKEAPDLSKPE